MIKHIGSYISSQALTSASYDTDLLYYIVSIGRYIMEIQIMAMYESYFKSFAAYLERGNYREVFFNALSKISTDVKLAGVKSCLAIGPGDGWCEIEFLKHCEANISKFIGIEPEHALAEHLRTSLMSNLPGVESQVLETTVENWEGPGKPVDFIMMFQVLYHIEPGKRQELLKKVHDSWLVSGGYLATLMASDKKSPNSVNRIYENLGCTTEGTWGAIEADFLKAGFTKQYKHEMQTRTDFTDVGEDLLPFFQLEVKHRVITLDDLREAITGLPSGGIVDEFHTLVVLKTTN